MTATKSNIIYTIEEEILLLFGNKDKKKLSFEEIFYEQCCYDYSENEIRDILKKMQDQKLIFFRSSYYYCIKDDFFMVNLKEYEKKIINKIMDNSGSEANIILIYKEFQKNLSYNKFLLYISELKDKKFIIEFSGNNIYGNIYGNKLHYKLHPFIYSKIFGEKYDNLINKELLLF